MPAIRGRRTRREKLTILSLCGGQIYLTTMFAVVCAVFVAGEGAPQVAEADVAGGGGPADAARTEDVAGGGGGGALVVRGVAAVDPRAGDEEEEPLGRLS